MPSAAMLATLGPTLDPGRSRRTALIVTLTALVSVLALCVNRGHNGDVYMQLLGGRFVAQHGFTLHDPFPTIAAGQPWHNQQWLSELAMYGVTRAVGLTGLTVVYALLLGLPLLALLVSCRDRRPLVLVAGTALYFPALLAIIHPRAASLTLVCFSLLTLLVMRRFVAPAAAPSWGTVAAIAALFALWANLHGGFVSGLGLIALVGVGLEIDRRRGIPGTDRRRVAVLALAGVAALVATFATPLGPAVWSYVLSFSNPALPLATTEWQPVMQSAPAVVYVVLCAAFAAYLWHVAERPRRALPLLVTLGTLAAAIASLRNIVLLPPALFLQIAHSRASAGARTPLVAPLAAGTAAVAGALVWALALGPARTSGYLNSAPVRYALRHPMRRGRIATLAGIGSYLLWRSPRTQVVLDGWLEHFTPNELRDNYAVLRGWPSAAAAAARLRVGAVITRDDSAARLLEAHGFVVAASSRAQGKYLVRTR